MKEITGIFNIGTDRYTNLKNDLELFLKEIQSDAKIVSLNKPLVINILKILDKVNLSPLSVWHYMSYGWDFFYDLERANKVLDWRPKYSNVEMLVESYYDYKKNKHNKYYFNSPHRKKVKQRSLQIAKYFFKK